MLEPREREWWSRPEDAVEDEDPRAHEKLRLVMSTLEREQSYRNRAHLMHAAMYGNNNVIEYDTRTRPGVGSTLTLNVSRSMCDAVTSRIAAKSKPHLSYVTEGGDYEKQHNAELLERGVDGVFYQTDFYRTATRCFRDCTAMGITFARIWPNEDQERVQIDRWLPWNVILDDGESLYRDGEWRSFYTSTYEDRGKLAYSYREDEVKALDIRRLDDTYDDDAEFGRQSAAVRVRVLEAWHKPSGAEASDGRHVIAVKNCTLLDEPWNPRKDAHPFAQMNWSDPIDGTFYGQGLIELMMGLQTEVNKLLRQIQNGHHLICGQWLIERGSKVVLAHINNDLARLLQYSGIKPEYQVPQIIAPEVYAHLWALVSKMYEIASINQQTAAAQKPAGLDSGEAQRVYADQQTETLLEKGLRYEAFVQDCGVLSTHAAKKLAKKSAYEVRSMSDDGFDTINWKDVDDPDGYEAQIAVTSSLPGTPSGKIALANDYQKLGLFDAGDIAEVCGMADILAITKRKQSSRKLVEKVVGEMLREGTPYEPTMFLRLREAAVLARDMLNEAEAKHSPEGEPSVPDENLQLVRDFVVKAIQLAKQLESEGNPLQPAVPAPPPPSGGQPMPAPQPAPMAPPQQVAA